MTGVKIKGTIKAINIRGDTMKLAIELPLENPNATFLLPLLNEEVSIVFTDPQTKLPLEEE